jgi:hypothetical protein
MIEPATSFHEMHGWAERRSAVDCNGGMQHLAACFHLDYACRTNIAAGHQWLAAPLNETAL